MTAEANSVVHYELHNWDRAVDESDRRMLAHCVGPTLDIGCGPGRMAAHLAQQGRAVLGVDLVGDAVQLTRKRGATALHRDIFGPMPGEGRWQTALLADGNIGIGGDPVALLMRVSELIADEGRIVAELAPPGSGLITGTAQIAISEVNTGPLPWAWVACDVIETVAAGAGLQVRTHEQVEDRWFAVLERDG